MANYTGKRKLGDQSRRGPLWLRRAISGVHDRVTASTPLNTSDVTVSDSSKGKILQTNSKSKTARSVGKALKVRKNGTVAPGTVFGIMPKIGGVLLTASTPPTLTLTGSGTRYVVITATGTPNQSTLDSKKFTNSTTFTAIDIHVTSTDPGAGGLNNTGSGTFTFDFVLAVLPSGSAIPVQNGYGPITGATDDVQDGTGNVLLDLQFTS